MEFKTTALYPAGDHLIVVGEVLSLVCPNESLDDDEPGPNDLPLVYWARRCRNLMP